MVIVKWIKKEKNKKINYKHYQQTFTNQEWAEIENILNNTTNQENNILPTLNPSDSFAIYLLKNKNLI